jgi:hypothetical protein
MRTAEVFLSCDAALSLVGAADWLEVRWTPHDGPPVSLGHDAAYVLLDRFIELRRRAATGEPGTSWAMTPSAPVVVTATLEEARANRLE